MADSPKFSRLITTTHWLALACLTMLPISVLGIRLGILPTLSGLAVFALACMGGLLLLLALAAAAMLPMFAPQRPRIYRSMMLAAAPALVCITLLGGGEDVPSIHNITTDPADPPAFEAAIAIRGDGSNPLEYGTDVARQQLAAYPDLTPIESSLPPSQAFATALSIAEELGWEIYAQDPAGGHIEAVDTTFWFGFKDDIVVRIRPSPQGSTVDLRSVSRVGRSDLGANAARIRNFTSRFGD